MKIFWGQLTAKQRSIIVATIVFIFVVIINAFGGHSSNQPAKSSGSVKQALVNLDNIWGQEGWARCAATFIHVSVVFIQDSSVTNQQKDNLENVSNIAGMYRKKMLAAGIPDQVLGAQLKYWGMRLDSQGSNGYVDSYTSCNADLARAFTN